MNFELMKNFMDWWTEEFTPGCCTIVYKDGKEVFRYQAGYADLENKVKLTGNELFNIYSCSKVAAVTAALQLYEKGKFLLEEPLYEYIPEYRDMLVKNKDGNVVKATKHITLRHLFTMTAGFTYVMDSDIIDRVREQTNGKVNTLALIKEYAKQPLAFEPGTHWSYSHCHDVLGAVVEVISGKKYRDYVRENIFEPLGMNNSYFHLPEDKKDKMAVQYKFQPNGVENDDIVKMQMSKTTSAGTIRRTDNSNIFDFGEEFDQAGGGIISTPDDYAKFIAALANYGTGLNGEKILSKGAVDLMRTNQLNGDLLKDLTWPDCKGYGYGLGVRTMIDRAASGSLGSYGEFGWSGAAGSTTLADPECNLAMFFGQHILGPRESYYCPRLRNILYNCIK
ncbi:MAG: serine hydrolase domain-containing protein [Clostridia bacterium]|nr:serine hydrolase domain-containing protein [Clostridia bacterium]